MSDLRCGDGEVTYAERIMGVGGFHVKIYNDDDDIDINIQRIRKPFEYSHPIELSVRESSSSTSQRSKAILRKARAID